ncbi:hypothetical protein ACFWFI_09645 [Streptomyces sp. NPDC060209]|uniref:hypothetical protein n=1 Tax=Streptomyces sp. NPDC060209 TaxID=3347073 RepID=UPI003664CC36
MTTESEADTLELPPVPEFGTGRPRWAAQRIHPRRLARGHLAKWASLKAWAIAVDHPKQPNVVAARATGLAAGALMAWRAANEEPRLLAIAAGGWVISAWRAGRPVPLTEEELQRRFLVGIQHLIGDRPGIHLAELYAAFQARPAAAHLDDARLRALLNHCHVTVTKSLRIGAVTGRSGIKATDIKALLSPAPVDTPSEDVDAGQTDTEGAVDQPEEAVEQPVDRP